jgi:hypothetical protein
MVKFWFSTSLYSLSAGLSWELPHLQRWLWQQWKRHKATLQRRRRRQRLLLLLLALPWRRGATTVRTRCLGSLLGL